MKLLELNLKNYDYTKPIILGKWHFNIRRWILLPAEINPYIELLNTKEEKEKLYRQQIFEEKQLSLSGKLIIYMIISLVSQELYNLSDDDFQLVWKSIVFEQTTNGKPKLGKDFIMKYPKMKNFTFNIAHHGDYTLVVTGFNLDLGIDVMKICLPPSDKNTNEFFSWYKDELSREEWEEIYKVQSLSQEIDNSSIEKRYTSLNRFMEFWCLKECLIKGIGIGLSLPLICMNFQMNSKPICTNEGSIWTRTKCSFELDKYDQKCEIQTRSLDGWGFVEGYIDELHCYAIAHKPYAGNNIEGLTQSFNVVLPWHFINLFDKL